MTWVSANLDLIAERTLQHLLISIPAIMMSFVLSIPIGWAAHRYRYVRGPALVISGLLYALPSLPLLVILPLIFGFGLRSEANIVTALTLYGIALMVRSVKDGFDSVDTQVVQSAAAIGYGSGLRFWTVQLPLAGPVLLAGLRIVAVSTISLVTVAAVIGISSLGSLFTDGLQRGIVAEVIIGLVLTMLLALLVDLLLVVLGRWLMPWSAPARTGRPIQDAGTLRVLDRLAESEGRAGVRS